MMTKEKAWQLAEEAGMDKEKFVSLLQKEGISEEVMEEELDNVCGGSGGTGRHDPTCDQ